MADWLAFSTTDIATFVACALMLGAYHLFLHCKPARVPRLLTEANRW